MAAASIASCRSPSASAHEWPAPVPPDSQMTWLKPSRASGERTISMVPGAVVTAVLPRDREVDYVERIYCGLRRCAAFVERGIRGGHGGIVLPAAARRSTPQQPGAAVAQREHACGQPGPRLPAQPARQRARTPQRKSLAARSNNRDRRIPAASRRRSSRPRPASSPTLCAHANTCVHRRGHREILIAQIHRPDGLPAMRRFRHGIIHLLG